MWNIFKHLKKNNVIVGQKVCHLVDRVQDGLFHCTPMMQTSLIIRSKAFIFFIFIFIFFIFIYLFIFLNLYKIVSL